MVEGKPIIGIVGGIGSGKSFVARLFGEMGCHVIDSDAQVSAAYQDPVIRKSLADRWGTDAFNDVGQINRPWIARKVFADPRERAWLEQLIHPWVNSARLREMQKMSRDRKTLAFVWDTPLLFETGLNAHCDAVVFVDAPPDVRLGRVGLSRGWGAEELTRRENSQWALDKKRELSDYVVNNAADAAQVRDQVRELLPRILAETTQRSAIGKDASSRRPHGENP